MKLLFCKSRWLFLTFLSVSSAVDHQNGSVSEDDQKFWDRLLQNDGLSVPNQPPVPVPISAPIPTPKPAPVPVPLPVLAPSALLNCRIDVSLDCTTSNGTTCDMLPPVDAVCGMSQLSLLQFRLNAGRRCIPNGNSQDATCLDCANVTSTGPFTVLCKDAATGKNLTVIPRSVEQGEIFTVTSSVTNEPIPNSIDCIYIDEKESKIQQNVIDTSEDAALVLKDKFGAFTLMSCDAGLAGGSDAKTCLETLSYNVGISNVGPVELEIKDLDFTIGNRGTTTFLNDLASPILRPGDSTALEVLLFLDLCVESAICAEAKVEAIPTNGFSGQCQAIERTCLQIFSRPPNPVPAPIYVPVPVPTPVKLQAPTPVKMPVTYPVKQPYAAPVTLPLPVPVPVPVPAAAPIQSPTAPPPVPAIPTIPTTPVTAPKSKTGMSKAPPVTRNMQ